MKERSIIKAAFLYAAAAIVVMAITGSFEMQDFVFSHMDENFAMNLITVWDGKFITFLFPAIGLLAGTLMAQKYLKSYSVHGLERRDDFLKLSLLCFILLYSARLALLAWRNPFLVSLDLSGIMIEATAMLAIFFLMNKRFLEKIRP